MEARGRYNHLLLGFQATIVQGASLRLLHPPIQPTKDIEKDKIINNIQPQCRVLQLKKFEGNKKPFGQW